MSKKILVVDDETPNRSVVSRFVNVCGYETYQADNGQTGLEIVLSQHPDMVITDINMPVMDGLELIRRLREDDLTKNTKIIVLSGRPENEQKSIDAGADAYISKPYNLSELKKTIHRYLGE